jgi:glycosyltransferase involved in cell wall biosynthesis
MDKVLIITPTYNGEKYIKETIDSCLNQTYKNLEIIVVDDCSSDSTVEILNSYTNRINLTTNQNNQGITKNLNKALPNRKDGKYFIFLGHDDVLPPNHVEIMVNEFDDNTIFVHCNNMGIDKNGNETGLIRDDNIQIKKTSNCLFELSIDNFITSCGMMHRVDIFQKIGGLDEKWKNWAEWLLYVKELGLNDGVAKYTTKTRAFYRRHETNITYTMKQKHIKKSVYDFKKESRHLAHKLNNNTFKENIKYYLNEIKIPTYIFIKNIIFWDKIRPYIKGKK